MTTELKPKPQKKFRKFILALIATIGVIATLIGNAETIGGLYSKLFKKKGVHFVDVIFRHETVNNYLVDTIDIKIRNNGEDVVLLKKLKLNIKKRWSFTPISGYVGGALLPSAYYHLSFEGNKQAPYELELPISHEIGPNKAERFFITIGRSEQYILLQSNIYLCDLIIEYNETNMAITKNNIILGFLNHYAISYFNFFDAYECLPQVLNRDSCIKLNREHYQELIKVNGMASKDVDSFIRRAEEDYRIWRQKQKK